jgi:hypothetical protein
MVGDSGILPPPHEVLVPAEIKTAAARGKLAFFVGNGISRLYGMPSWEELCSRMFRSLAAQKIINHNTVDLLARQPLKTRISIADHYFKKASKERTIHELTYRSMFYGDRTGSLQELCTAYASLARCGAKFVTTNYDDLLDEALELAAKVAEPIKTTDIGSQESPSAKVERPAITSVTIHRNPYQFNRFKSLAQNVVFHLHGSVHDEENLVASTLSYLKLYGDPNVQDFLRWFFENHVVVFLGYGLDELELLDLIVRSGTRDAAGKRKHSIYLLLPALSHEADILQELNIYYDQLGITPLAFSRDQKDYHSYADLLEIWAGELAGVAEAPTRVDELSLLDSLIAKVEGGAK